MKRQGKYALDNIGNTDDCAVKLFASDDGSGHHDSTLGSRWKSYLQRVSRLGLGGRHG